MQQLTHLQCSKSTILDSEWAESGSQIHQWALPWRAGAALEMQGFTFPEHTPRWYGFGGVWQPRTASLASIPDNYGIRVPANFSSTSVSIIKTETASLDIREKSKLVNLV